MENLDSGDGGKRVVVSFTLEDGTQAFVEARADGPDDHGRAMISGTTLAKGFENVAATIKSMTTDLKTAILAASPQEAELEFGVDVKMESGALAALIVSGDVSATLKVTLRWKSEKAAS